MRIMRGALVLGLALMGLGGSAGAAPKAKEAAPKERKITCLLEGEWVESKDKWAFQADYIVKDGPDSFTGKYVNADKGTSADVKGYSLKGTWSINMTWTNQKDQGMVRELTGTGDRDPKTGLLEVKGTYKTTKRPELSKTQKGNFVLKGTCS